MKREVVIDGRGGLTIDGRPVIHLGLSVRCRPPDYMTVLEVELPLVELETNGHPIEVRYIAQAGTASGHGTTVTDAVRDLLQELEERNDVRDQLRVALEEQPDA